MTFHLYIKIISRSCETNKIYMNIKKALQGSIKQFESHNIPSANLDAEVLLLEVLNISRLYTNNISEDKHDILSTFQNDNFKLERSWIYAHNDYELTGKENIIFNNYITRRLKQEPVAYILNRKEFFGYEFFVNENVLIPRPETELIVKEVLEIIKNKKYFIKQYNLIDIVTGSCCILISILNELQKNNYLKLINQSIAIDISKTAIEIAKANAKKYNFENNIKFINGDLTKEINQKLFSDSNDYIITANLPYISNDDYEQLENNVKDFEPKLALASGIDGLDDISALLCSLSKVMFKNNQNIYILLEADPNQIDYIIKEFDIYFKKKESTIIEDFSEKNRIIVTKIGF